VGPVVVVVEAKSVELDLQLGERLGAGSLMRLGSDEAATLEDAPDGGGRRQIRHPALEVVEDGLGPGIEAGLAQLLTDPDDFRLDLRRCLVGAGSGSPRARLKGRVPTLPVACEQLVDPEPGNPMTPGELSDTPPFQNHRLHQIARQAHPTTSVLVASTMSCDICQLCGELRYH
jgi:hypothetical protein